MRDVAGIVLACRTHIQYDKIRIVRIGIDDLIGLLGILNSLKPRFRVLTAGFPFLEQAKRPSLGARMGIEKMRNSLIPNSVYCFSLARTSTLSSTEMN